MTLMNKAKLVIFSYGGTGALQLFIFETAFDGCFVCTGKYSPSIHPLNTLSARTVHLPRSRKGELH
jgi:hypothetical protein